MNVPCVARGDYAACSASTNAAKTMKGNTCYSFEQGGPGSLAAASSYDWVNPKYLDGVTYQRRTTKPKDIVDGLSHTILYGEKYVMANHYYDGKDPAENESMYNGFDNDNTRCTNYDSKNPSNPAKSYVPHRDKKSDTAPGSGYGDAWGSPHSTACNFVFCDGSVHGVSYETDSQTFKYLCSRNDRQVIDMAKMPAF